MHDHPVNPAAGAAAREDAHYWRHGALPGVDLLFVTGSIHAGELDAFGNVDPQAVADLVAPSGANLAGFLPRLSW